MTFDEREHPRAPSGTFVDKAQGTPEVSLAAAPEPPRLTLRASQKTMRDAEAKIEAAEGAVRAAKYEQRAVAAAHLKVLAREHAPDASRIILSSYATNQARVLRFETADGKQADWTGGATANMRLAETAALLGAWTTLADHAERHGEFRDHEYAMEVR